MGGGYVVSFRYKGIYYNRHTSANEFSPLLGSRLVNSIPRDKERFKDWLTRKREFYEEQRVRWENNKVNYDDFSESEEARPSQHKVDCHLPWIFTVDLDRLVFTVNNFAHFQLDHMPRIKKLMWTSFLSIDGWENSCLNPSTPAEFVANFLPEAAAPSVDSLASYERIRPGLRALNSVEWTAGELSPIQELTITFAAAFIKDNYSILSTVSQFPPSEIDFREPALALLSVIAPGLPVVSMGSHAPWEESAAVKRANVKYKVKHVFRKMSGTVFWLRGRLIVLSSHLDHEETRMALIADTVTRLRSKELEIEECIALLWSVKHVVVVSLSRDTIAISSVIPIVAALADASGDALRVGLRLLVHYLKPSLDHGVASRQCPACVESSHTVSKDSAFLRRALPLDITLQIMSFSDSVTYRSFESVCQATRKEALRHPRLGQYRLLSGHGTTFRATFTSGAPMDMHILYDARDEQAEAMRRWSVEHGCEAERPAFEELYLFFPFTSEQNTEKLLVPLCIGNGTHGGIYLKVLLGELPSGLKLRDAPRPQDTAWD